MNLDICPMLLDVETVDKLTPEILNEFVEISNSTIVQYIEYFMDKHRHVSDEVIQRVIEKLRVAYNSYYEYQAFVNSADLAEAFRLIVTQNKSSISFDMDRSELINIRDTCRRVLTYEDKLKRYDVKSLKLHIERMENLAQVSGDEELVRVVKTLTRDIKSLKHMFINATDREDDRTVLYRIFKFKDKAIQLANTADACLSKMGASEDGSTTFDKRMWRHI